MPKESRPCCKCYKMTRTQDVTISFRGLKIRIFKPGMQLKKFMQKKSVSKRSLLFHIRSCVFTPGFQASGADVNFLSLNSLLMQVDALSCLGLDVGMGDIVGAS